MKIKFSQFVRFPSCQGGVRGGLWLLAFLILNSPLSIVHAQTPGARGITYNTNFIVTATNKITFVAGLAVTNAPSSANDVPRYLDLTNSTTALQTQITSSTNRLAVIEANTNTWNTAGTVAANATNRVLNLENNTNTWNTASTVAANATNRVLNLEGNTNTWNTAGTVAANATNRVLNLENNTNTWNTAGTVAANATNRVLTLENRTNIWNGAITGSVASTHIGMSNSAPNIFIWYILPGSPLFSLGTNSGASLLNLNASQLLSGTIPTARYGSEVIQTNSVNFRWSQSFYIGQLANSTYNNSTLTLTTFQNKTIASYQTNFPATIPVWNLPADRLKGKSIILKSLWVNYNGAGVSGNITVDQRILGSTNSNNAWLPFSPYSGGDPHFNSTVTRTATVPGVTNTFFLVTTNSIPSNAMDAEASVFFKNDTTTFTTNLGLIGVYSEEIP